MWEKIKAWCSGFQATAQPPGQCQWQLGQLIHSFGVSKHTLTIPVSVQWTVNERWTDVACRCVLGGRVGFQESCLKGQCWTRRTEGWRGILDFALMTEEHKPLTFAALIVSCVTYETYSSRVQLYLHQSYCSRRNRVTVTVACVGVCVGLWCLCLYKMVLTVDRQRLCRVWWRARWARSDNWRSQLQYQGFHRHSLASTALMRRWVILTAELYNKLRHLQKKDMDSSELPTSMI